MSTELPRGLNWFNVQGFNSKVDTGTTPEDIWDGGGLYTFPTVAAASTIVSSSANDTAAGTGARTVEVRGLNAAGMIVVENATMNGITPVALTNQYLRLIRARVKTVGSTGSNVGIITIASGGTTLCAMPATYGLSKLGVYTVPANFTKCLFSSYYFSIMGGAATFASVAIQVRPPGESWLILEVLELEATGTSSIQRSLETSPEFVPLTDVRATCFAVGANNTQISCGIELAQS